MSIMSLTVLSGSPLPPIELTHNAPLSLGRSSRCDVHLDDQTVSRRHAEIANGPAGWTITDTGSRHGLTLNGAPIKAGVPTLLAPGDHIRIGPWTFRFANVDDNASTLVSRNDTTDRVASRIPETQLSHLAEIRLALLMEAARAIQSATEEHVVAQAVVEALVNGTGFDRAALIRPVDGVAELTMIAMYTKDERSCTPFQPSRTLLQAARAGEIVRLEDDLTARGAISIILSDVTSAICAPVKINAGIDSFVYLDSIGRSRPYSDAAAFCAAITDLCGLALSNLRSHALQTQQNLLLRDLHTARDVQRRLMPHPSGRVGPVRYALHFQPGRVVAGDFFGARALGARSAMLFIGDVAGKGLGASLMMASIQAHLDALIDSWPASARTIPSIVSELNRYVAAHSATNEFASLWIGLIETDVNRLTCVDAGHGYVLLHSGGGIHRPIYEGGPPIGVDPEAAYEQSVLPFMPNDRVILMSDGVPEQSSATGSLFGVDRAMDALDGSVRIEDDLVKLLESLVRFADATEFGDDVTIASIAHEPVAP